MVKNISSFHGSVDDTAGSLAVTDVDNFHIVICESIQKLRIQLTFGSHAKTYETIIEWKFIFALAAFYQEGICFYFQKSSFGQLMYAMFFHHASGIVFGYRIQITADLIHHFNDRDISFTCCKEFHNIQTYGTAADNSDFFTFQILREIVDMIDHT